MAFYESINKLVTVGTRIVGQCDKQLSLSIFTSQRQLGPELLVSDRQLSMGALTSL